MSWFMLSTSGSPSKDQLRAPFWTRARLWRSLFKKVQKLSCVVKEASMQQLQFAELPAEIQADILTAEQETTHTFPPNRSTKHGAVLKADGQKFTGANIRRRAFSSSTCAERMVIDQALYAGVHKLQHLVVFGVSSVQPFESREVGMCGLCRQILSDALVELNQDDVQVILCGQEKRDVIITSLTELFPLAYKKPESQVVK